MAQVNLNRDELRNRIHGCFLGKSIGGTLGTPFECRTEMNDVHFYSQPTHGEPLPNDDLDLQLVWLKAVRENGPRAVNNRLLGEYWLNYIPPHWNEYGICKANMRAGLLPPLSGEYRNYWKHSNGAWIRSEIWACLAPGCPDIAIQYAYEDASVDHGGGEGTYAALFTAAVESAAFVTSNREELIEIGLSKIPPDCRTARSIKIVLDAYSRGKSWQEARTLVVEDSSDLGWFQAPANVAFVVIGWMYGENDFGKSICTAVNCGDDTDCTGATLGAILGIILGKDGIPSEWIEPIGDRIITVAIDRGSMQVPSTLAQLTDQVMEQIPIMLATHGTPVTISDEPTNLTQVNELNLTSSNTAQSIWTRSPFAMTYDFIHTLVTLDYGKAPDLKPGEPFPLTVTLTNKLPDSRHLELKWRLPEGWTVSPSTVNHVALWIGCTTAVEVAITAENLRGGVYRGMLEVIAFGRPTVGAIPLVFFA
ncbi:MAG: ADP-ribosylglycohydrolase family protein [Armatimonadetes bacterium]|nr:ADP-ribosylglycohydrolase family protein [Armatimonadota bacterium]